MLKKIRKFIFITLLAFILVPVLMVLFLRFIPPLTSSFMIQKMAVNVYNEGKFNIQYDWVSIDEISDKMKLAVIAAEDQKFIDHWGFDIDEISKAMKSNKKKKRIRGASTITQQTAKNLFLWSDKSYVRKGLEVYFTVLIELFWTKERILEVYLNIAEFGNNIYGVKAASNKYFRIDPIKMNSAQSASLAAILPNPKRFLVQSPTINQQRRAAWIQLQMRQLGYDKLKEL